MSRLQLLDATGVVKFDSLYDRALSYEGSASISIKGPLSKYSTKHNIAVPNLLRDRHILKVKKVTHGGGNWSVDSVFLIAQDGSIDCTLSIYGWNLFTSLSIDYALYRV